ncbi:hypothetical protein FALBO_11007, partial [Fusarium albosuccineum]
LLKMARENGPSHRTDGGEPAPKRPRTRSKAAQVSSQKPTSPAYRPGEPISTSIARFKAWKREGGLHDTVCFACKTPGVLDNCPTCRLSYHEACKPQETIEAQQVGSPWYCHICIGRNWHMEPPSLTPPASPVLPPLEQVGGGRGTSLTGRAEQQNMAPPTANIAQPGQDNITLGGAPQELQHPTDRAFGPPVSARPPTGDGDQTITAIPSASSEAERPNRARQPRAAPKRKSRFSTLPADIDSALRVLYGELETATELRQQVTRLETETTQLRQELDLRKKELVLAQKAAEMARSSQAEITRLRSEVSERQAAVDEIATLRAEKQELEAELQNSRDQVNKMTQTLQDWRRSLTGLIGD